MRHDSVASLAERDRRTFGRRARGEDLIAAAGLDPTPPTADAAAICSSMMPVNPGAGLRRLELERVRLAASLSESGPGESPMTSTTTAFLAVSQNLSRYQTMTAAEPAVKTATAYYEANIGSVKSISDLVGNYRLLSYALNAYGLGDQINAKGLITKVLEGGVSNPKSLANTLPNSRWKAFAAAFNFVDSGATPPSSTSAVATTTSDYVEQQLESDQGDQDVGVQLALYFQRVAPTVTQRIWDSWPIPIFCKWRRRSWGSRRRSQARCSRRRSPSSCPSPTCKIRPSSSS